VEPALHPRGSCWFQLAPLENPLQRERVQGRTGSGAAARAPCSSFRNDHASSAMQLMSSTAGPHWFPRHHGPSAALKWLGCASPCLA